VQDPPQTQTVVVERTKLSPWLGVGVGVSVILSAAALLLSLWPRILG
jgi:ubiquinone biosynthesis protein